MSDVVEQDYLDYFGKTRDEILDLYGRDIPESTVRRGAFNRLVTEVTPEKLLEYYNSWEFVSVLYARRIVSGYFEMVERELGSDEFLSGAIRRYCQKGVRVLDYGCGPSKVGIYAASFGADVILADINTRGFRFVCFLCGRHRPHIRWQTLKSDCDDLGKPYDFVICREVFEHLIDPIGAMQNIADHMKIGAMAYLSWFFDDCEGHDPSHLKQNNIYGDYKGRWYPEMVKAGLIEVERNSANAPKIFKRVEKGR